MSEIYFGCDEFEAALKKIIEVTGDACFNNLKLPMEFDAGFKNDAFGQVRARILISDDAEANIYRLGFFSDFNKTSAQQIFEIGAESEIRKKIVELLDLDKEKLLWDFYRAATY